MEQELVAAMAGLGTVIIFSTLAATIAQIAGMGLAFRKAGDSWWKAIIPIYDVYTQTKIAKAPMSWFWIMLGTIFGGCFIIGIGTGMALAVDPTGTDVGGAALVLILLGTAATLAGAVYSLMISYRLVRAFGKGVGFFIGLLLFAPIFWLILGLDSSEYQLADKPA
ncbi:MAG: DUF5684 domain-containing protein [Coriobacteriia bacterium]|nr:DUF5684 domain-containing protein [Coriobacteriia bacterium]